MSVFAGMVKTQLVLLVQGLVPMVSEAEEYPPPERMMVPVGVTPEPVIETVTFRLALELSVEDCGVTVTVGMGSVDCDTVI